MKFEKGTPKVSCINSLTGFNHFLQHGQTKFCQFLIDFLNLKEVRIQANDISVLIKWLHVDSLDMVMEVPGCEDEICVVSQIKTNNELLAFYICRNSNNLRNKNCNSSVIIPQLIEQ